MFLMADSGRNNRFNLHLNMRRTVEIYENVLRFYGSANKSHRHRYGEQRKHMQIFRCTRNAKMQPTMQLEFSPDFIR